MFFKKPYNYGGVNKLGTKEEALMLKRMKDKQVNQQ